MYAKVYRKCRTAALAVFLLIPRAFACSAVPTVLVDARLDDPPIVFANARLLRLRACAEEEAMGQNLRSLNTIDADPEVIEW
jgi:hypothetical protein